MANIFPVGRSGVKPQRGRLLNPLHPIARGLVIAMPFNECAGAPINVVTGKPSLPYATPYWSASTGGAAFNAAPNSNLLTLNHPSITSDSFTVEAYFYFNASTTSASTGSGLWSTQSKTACLCFLGGGNEAVFYQSGNGKLGPTGITYPANVLQHWIGVAYGTSCTLYQQGYATATATITTTVSSFTTSYVCGTNTTSIALQGGFVGLHAWARPLTAQEVNERFADPWGIYQSSPIARFWMAPTSSPPPIFRRSLTPRIGSR